MEQPELSVAAGGSVNWSNLFGILFAILYKSWSNAYFMPSFTLNRYIPIVIACWGYSLYSRSHPNLARLHMPRWNRRLQKRGHGFCNFLCCCILPSEAEPLRTQFARWGSVNTNGAAVSMFVCTGEVGQGCRPTSWLRKPWILTFQVCTQNKGE